MGWLPQCEAWKLDLAAPNDVSSAPIHVLPWTSASSPALGRSRALVGAGAPPRAPARPAPCGLSRRPGSPSEPPPAAAAWSPDTPGLGPAGDGHGYGDARDVIARVGKGRLEAVPKPRPRGFAALRAPNATRAGDDPGRLPCPACPSPVDRSQALLPGGPAAGRKGLSRHILAPLGAAVFHGPLAPVLVPARPPGAVRPTDG